MKTIARFVPLSLRLLHRWLNQIIRLPSLKASQAKRVEKVLKQARSLDG